MNQNNQFTEIDVKYVLQGLRSCVINDSPLLYLTLVEQHLREFNLADTPTARRYALSALVIVMLRKNYRKARRLHNLPKPQRVRTYTQVLTCISEEAGIQHASLLGWSWFYYHYVVTDLEITIVDFSSAASLHPRTLLRYHDQMLSRLTYQLMDAECLVNMRFYRNSRAGRLAEIKLTASI